MQAAEADKKQELKPPDKPQGISTEPNHQYIKIKGVKYRVTSSFLMDQKRKRLEKHKIKEKKDVPDYFKNFIVREDHSVFNRTKAMKKYLE